MDRQEMIKDRNRWWFLGFTVTSIASIGLLIVLVWLIPEYKNYYNSEFKYCEDLRWWWLKLILTLTITHLPASILSIMLTIPILMPEYQNHRTDGLIAGWLMGVKVWLVILITSIFIIIIFSPLRININKLFLIRFR